MLFTVSVTYPALMSLSGALPESCLPFSVFAWSGVLLSACAGELGLFCWLGVFVPASPVLALMLLSAGSAEGAVAGVLLVEGPVVSFVSVVEVTSVDALSLLLGALSFGSTTGFAISMFCVLWFEGAGE